MNRDPKPLADLRDKRKWGGLSMPERVGLMLDYLDDWFGITALDYGYLWADIAKARVVLTRWQNVFDTKEDK